MPSGGKRDGAGCKPRAITLSKNHSIKFTDGEWKRIEKLAKDQGVSCSEYIRLKLRSERKPRKIPPSVLQAKEIRARNYAKLRKAGFSVKDALRLRTNATQATLTN